MVATYICIEDFSLFKHFSDSHCACLSLVVMRMYNPTTYVQSNFVNTSLNYCLLDAYLSSKQIPSDILGMYTSLAVKYEPYIYKI